MMRLSNLLLLLLLSGGCLVRLTTAQYDIFTSTEDLYWAVDDYLSNSTSNLTASALRYGYPMGTWDVALITNFTRLFDPDRSTPFDGSGCGSIQSTFNEDISDWNVGNAVTMVGMFACTEFNQDISLWSVGNVRNMSGLFMFATGKLFVVTLSKYIVGFYSDANLTG
jgi:Mycoplasma protein of unknown function, DUF285